MCFLPLKAAFSFDSKLLDILEQEPKRTQMEHKGKLLGCLGCTCPCCCGFQQLRACHPTVGGLQVACLGSQNKTTQVCLFLQ